MASTIQLRHEHRTGLPQARDRVRRFLDGMAATEGVRGEWAGDRCKITGTGLTGTVLVTERHVEVTIDLALAMRPFSSLVRNTVADGLASAFDPAGDADPTEAGPPDSTVELDRIDRLVRDYRPGYSLDAAFYNDPGVFARDLDRVVFPLWSYVEHESAIPNPGDYLLFDIAGESIIVIRGRDGVVRAFYNVCTHRGSRICLTASGNRQTLVCPYHAWGFDTDGTLRSARAMPDDFDKREHHLRTVGLRIVHGLIYLNLAERPLDFDPAARMLDDYLAPHGLARAKVAHRERYLVAANWKLVTENFLECYHCAPAHPEYCSVNQHARANSLGTEALLADYQRLTEEWSAYAATLGHPVGFQNHVRVADQPVVCYRQPIRPGFRTLSQDGEPVAPLMGTFADYDGGETVVALGFHHFISAANDHVVTFRFTPLDVGTTEVVLSWLVDGAAVEGRDYQVDRLSWMWRVTTEQDKQITEDNQAGIRSRGYRPGRYAVVEMPVQRFVTEYLRMLSVVGR